MPSCSALASVVSALAICWFSWSNPGEFRARHGRRPRWLRTCRSHDTSCRPRRLASRPSYPRQVGSYGCCAGGATGKTFLLEAVLHVGTGKQAGNLPVTGAAGVATEPTAGGTAPWFPWQLLQVGALRSPLSISARPCTLAAIRHIVRGPRGGRGIDSRPSPWHPHDISSTSWPRGYDRPATPSRRRPVSVFAGIFGRSVGLAVQECTWRPWIARGFQRLAVTAGPVFGQLIGSRRRLVVLHVLDVGVAVAAERGNVGG